MSGSGEDSTDWKTFIWGEGMIDHINKNAVLTQVLDKLVTQTNKGVDKYGKTVNPADYSTVEWIDHAIEESIDQVVYLTCLKMKIVEGKK